jgi:hypothetical protein
MLNSDILKAKIRHAILAFGAAPEGAEDLAGQRLATQIQGSREPRDAASMPLAGTV